MDINFFEDCGLEGHDYLHHELAQVCSDYLAAVTAALNSTESASDCADCTPQRNKDDTTLDHDENFDDFTTPIKSFFEHRCDCCYGRNQSSCTKSLDFDEVVDHRMQCIELLSTELDLIVLGALAKGGPTHRVRFRWHLDFSFPLKIFCSVKLLLLLMHPF